DNPLKATMSAVYTRVAGTNDPRTGLPNNILVKPEAVKDKLKLGSNFETGALPTLTQAGNLGKTFAAFDSSGGGALKDNMELRLPKLRLGDRRVLLRQLDRIRFDAEKNGTMDRVDKYRRQAFEIITRGIGEAFEAVARRLEEQHALIGFDIFCGRHRFAEIPSEQVEKSIRLFGEKVVPALS
ncbi:hypothetical protein IIA16_06330, partial [bacterium]|nr:hypothetical protein [bacterium]